MRVFLPFSRLLNATLLQVSDNSYEKEVLYSKIFCIEVVEFQLVIGADGLELLNEFLAFSEASVVNYF